MAGHADDLFSQAYERELRGDARERFETHLAACAVCHAGYAEYRASIDALRALPAATMPVTVHLPSTPPVAATPSLWARISAMPRTLRVTAAMLLTGASIAGAVSFTGHSNPSLAALTTTSGGAAIPQASPLTNPAADVQGAAPYTSVNSTCTPTSLTTSGAASPPTGFGNQVTRTDAGRVTLTLATTASHAAAGSTVLVYARFTSAVAVAQAPGGTGAAAPPPRQAVPCVTLVGSAPALAAGSTTAQSPNNYGAANPGVPPLSEAVPTSDVRAEGMPLQAIVIPAGLAKGTVVDLVATVPAASAGTPVTVTLQITID